MFNKKSADSIDCFVAEVLKKCEEVNQIKSRWVVLGGDDLFRSFGLSLGHRLKTRLVLVLLVLVRLRPLSSTQLQAVVDLCVDTILDGSQQYSIRLPVEWILTTVCLQNPAFLHQWMLRGPEVSTRCVG